MNSIYDRLDRITTQMRADGVSNWVIIYIYLQFQVGLRISDLLSISAQNISRNLTISVSQGKGSEKMTFQPVHFREEWQRIRDNNLAPMEFYNRFYFYRLYKRYGINKVARDNVNSSVTHLARRAVAEDVYEQSQDIQAVKRALGHKSVRSTQYYVNRESKKTTAPRGVSGSISGEISNIVIQKNDVIRIKSDKKKRDFYKK